MGDPTYSTLTTAAYLLEALAEERRPGPVADMARKLAKELHLLAEIEWKKDGKE